MPSIYTEGPSVRGGTCLNGALFSKNGIKLASSLAHYRAKKQKNASGVRCQWRLLGNLGLLMRVSQTRHTSVRRAVLFGITTAQKDTVICSSEMQSSFQANGFAVFAETMGPLWQAMGKNFMKNGL